MYQIGASWYFWCSKFHHWRPNKAEFSNLPVRECEKSACYGGLPANCRGLFRWRRWSFTFGEATDVSSYCRSWSKSKQKVDIPHFTGEEQAEEVLDWLNEVERVIKFLNLPENKRVKPVAIKLKGYASSWWQQVQMTRVQSEKEKIQSWTKMQQQIWSQFLSLNYEGILFQQYQALQQGQRSVREYTNEFYKMWTRVQLTEIEVRVIHRYLMGLRPNVRNLVELQPCWTLSGVVQLAMKVENQQRWSNNHPIRSARGPNQLEDNRQQGDVK